MADPSTDRDAAEPDHDSIIGTPRWVKVFAIIGLVGVVVLIIMLLLGGGPGHSPDRHTGGLGTAPANLAASGSLR